MSSFTEGGASLSGEKDVSMRTSIGDRRNAGGGVARTV
jgi:hypothetical protein